MDEMKMRETIAAAVAEIGSLRKAAKQWGVSPSYLSLVLSGQQPPGPRVCEPVGYRQVVTVTYQRARP